MLRQGKRKQVASRSCSNGSHVASFHYTYKDRQRSKQRASFSTRQRQDCFCILSDTVSRSHNHLHKTSGLLDCTALPIRCGCNLRHVMTIFHIKRHGILPPLCLHVSCKRTEGNWSRIKLEWTEEGDTWSGIKPVSKKLTYKIFTTNLYQPWEKISVFILCDGILHIVGKENKHRRVQKAVSSALSSHDYCLQWAEKVRVCGHGNLSVGLQSGVTPDPGHFARRANTLFFPCKQSHLTRKWLKPHSTSSVQDFRQFLLSASFKIETTHDRIQWSYICLCACK